MKIGHMAVPSTWKTFQPPDDHALAGWWAVSNDVESVIAYFRVEDEALGYVALKALVPGKSEE